MCMQFPMGKFFPLMRVIRAAHIEAGLLTCFALFITIPESIFAVCQQNAMLI